MEQPVQEESAGNIKKSFDGENYARKINTCDYLFFPSLYSNHWFLFVVDIKNGLWIFLDSLFFEDDQFHKDVRKVLIPNFVKSWDHLGTSRIDFSKFRTIYPSVPKQGNKHDCGFFVMKFMEIWEPRVLLTDKFSKADITAIRVKYANSMMFSQHNIAISSQQLVYRFK